MLVPDTSDNGIGGCLVSFRGRPRAPGSFCFDPIRLDFWAELLGLGLVGRLTDEVFADLLGGSSADFENEGEENNPCLTDDEFKLLVREAGDPSGLVKPSPSLPNNDETGKAG